MQYNRRILFSVLGLLIAAMFTYMGCKNDEGVPVNTTGGDNVAVGFFTEHSGSDNTIIITEAKFVLRKMELEAEGSGEENEVNLGPFVVYLDLNSTAVVNVAIAKVAVGNFKEIHFQVHKPSPQENIADPDFTESTSKRFSVVVKGLFNGVPFVYKSPITVDREIEFEHQPITVAANALVYITISLDPYSWFISNGGILDPTVEANWHSIDHNIKESLKRAFRDMDRNGEPD